MEKFIILNKPYNNYAISDKGVVKNIKRDTVLHQFIRHDGYLQVSLWSDGKGKSFKVHRLVALAFLPNSDVSLYINHKDGNKLNNMLENLEWCTPSENNYHAVKLGLVNATPVSVEDMSSNTIYTFPSISQAAVFLNEDVRLLSRALKRPTRIVHGYRITKL